MNFFLAIFLCFASPAHGLKVAVSIAPLHSLVSQIMEGVSTPSLLLPGLSSPHGAYLTPSQLKKIESADLVFWIGPYLEAFLKKPLEGRQAYAVADQKDLHRLPLREEDHHQGHEDHHHHGHEDSHYWLSISNAKAIATAVCTILSSRDSANKSTYEKNLTHALARLEALEAHIKVLLKGSVPFFVYHDGYQYFEESFSLANAGTLYLNPDVPLSPQRLEKLMANQQARCFFVEAQFPSGDIEHLLSDKKMYMGTLDPYGSTIVPGPGAYETMMVRLAHSFQECFRHVHSQK